MTSEQAAKRAKPLILIADDEAMLADLLAQSLAKQGYDTITAANGMEAVRLVRERTPDLVILDIMMPVMDGMEALERIRQSSMDLPVLMLTAKDAVDDRVAGLRGGADDYVIKPFSLDEVAARIEALLRRSGIGPHHEAAPDSVLKVGDLTLNIDRHEVARANRPIELTKTEFDLCQYLMENAQRVVSKEQILDAVWHFDFGGKANVVELYISYLRRKIDEDAPSMIHTVRGVGYVMKPAEDVP